MSRSLSRRVGLARAAFDIEDEQISRQLSREAHGLLSGDASSCTNPSTPVHAPAGYTWFALSEAGHNEELAHRGATMLLRGAVDGVVVSIAALSLGDAASWPAKMTFIADGALLACLALYSACREALEIVTYDAHYKRERQRETWELDNFPEGEVKEMIELYSRKGLPEPAARQVVSLMALERDFFVDIMMLEELQMAPPPAVSALAAGARIGVSTIICGGALPLVAMLAHKATQTTNADPLVCSSTNICPFARPSTPCTPFPFPPPPLRPQRALAFFFSCASALAVILRDCAFCVLPPTSLNS